MRGLVVRVARYGKAWRLVVCLLLVPVVLFSSPQTAAATAAVSPRAAAGATGWVGAEWHISGVGVRGLEVHAADCGASLQMALDALGQVLMRTSGGYCIGMADLSPWSCQIFESSCTNFRLSFEGSGSCAGVSMVPAKRVHPGDSFTSVKSGWSADSTLAGTCDPTQACLEVWSDGSLMGGGGRACTAVELDPPGAGAPPDESCAAGRLAGASATIVQGGQPWLRDLKATMRMNLKVNDGQQRWFAYAITEEYQPTRTRVITLDNYRVPPAGVLGSWEWLDGEGAAWVVPDYPLGRILGVGVYALGLNGTVAWNSAGSAPTLLPQERSDGTAGLSDPSRCMWYFGEKVASTTTNDFDEPSAGLDGGVVEPEPDPPAPDGPSEVEDLPTADTEAGFWATVIQLLTALVSSVARLSGLIGGLASAIGAAVKAAMFGLLVPDALAISGQVATLVDDLKATSLAKWGAAFTGQTIAWPASGCSGVPVDVQLGPGVAVAGNLGAACEGRLAQAAALVKVLVSGQLVFMGGLACIRALGSGFGWSPGIGRGGGDGA